MGCPRSISLVSLSAQLYPLCLHPRMHCPSFLLPCCHQLSAFLTSTRNSKQFAQFITTQNVPDSEVLVFFGVMSLFTRVPTSRTIQVIRDRLMNDPSLPDRTNLTVDNICSLLQLCLEATYLSFESKVHRQIHGMAMGSPVSVVVANLVMEDVEQEALSTFHAPP